MLKVKYIGPKPSRSWQFEDRITWAKYGDVQEVAERHEQTIRQHPDIWEIVGHSNTPEPAEMPEETVEEVKLDPPLVDLNSMDKAQLQTYCQREFGEQVDKRWSEGRIRQYITSQIGRRR